jgi:hypothetical protein
MHTVTDWPLAFATRGSPLSKPDHQERVIRPAMKRLRTRSKDVIRLLETGTWDPGEGGCTETFGELVRLLDAGLDSVDELRVIMPPLELRAAHRELTRAIAQSVRGQILLALMISAPDYESALRLREEGTVAIAAGTQHAVQVTKLIRLIGQYPSDGPSRVDGSLDMAALAWSGVRRTTTSIKDAAELVRGAFAGLPDIPDLPDERAVLLLPALVAGAGVVDPQAVTQRVLRLRAALDAGSPPDSWLKEPGLLVARVIGAVDRAMSDVGRLGREWRYGLPRVHVMRTLTEVYRALVEGPLLDLGSVVLIAARAGRGDGNGSYEASVIDGVKAGEVVAELEILGAEAIERRIGPGQEVPRTEERLTDDEFAEDFAALHEMLLALRLTLLPWLWTTENQDLKAALARTSTSRRQVSQTIALLGGMAGGHFQSRDI